MAKVRDEGRAARWQRVVGEHGQSGLTAREFRRQSKLAESTFYFLRGKLARRGQEQSDRCDLAARPAVSGAAPATFVRVRVTGEIATEPAGRPDETKCRIEIVLQSGRRIHVTAPVDRTALADVLAVVEARCPEGLAC